MKKRILALALSVAMFLSFMPFSAFATEPVSYASELSDSAQYLMKLPEADTLGTAYQYNSDNKAVPIVEENGERFLVYNEENFSKFANQNAFYANVYANELTLGQKWGIPTEIPFEDASTMWLAVRMKINDFGDAFEKTGSTIRMFTRLYDETKSQETGNDEFDYSHVFTQASNAAKWLDAKDGSMTWFYADSGVYKGSSNKGAGNLEFTGDMDGYLMIPINKTSLTTEQLRNYFSGFRFILIEGTSAGNVESKESQWDDKELLIGDSFLVSDADDFQSDVIKAKNIEKYALNGGEDTAYQAIRIGGYRTRYYATGAGTGKSDFFNKNQYNPDVADIANSRYGLLHVTTLPNGDRALEISVNSQTDETTGTTSMLTYSGTEYYVGLPTWDTYDHLRDGLGNTSSGTSGFRTKQQGKGVPEADIDLDDMNYIAFRIAVKGTGTIDVKDGLNKGTHLVRISVGTGSDSSATATYFEVGSSSAGWNTLKFVDVNTGEVIDMVCNSSGVKIEGDVDGYLIVPIEDFGVTKATLQSQFGNHLYQEQSGTRIRLAKTSSYCSWDDGAKFYFGGAVWVGNEDTFTAYHTDCENVGHNYLKTGETAPDCDDAGSITYVCQRCDEPHTEPIPALGHEYGDLVPAVEEKHTSDKLDPAVDAYYQCSVCQMYFTEEKVETEYEALIGETPEHNYGEYVNTDEAQHWKECACGSKIEVANHDFDNGCDTTCDTCGYTRVTNHIYTTWSGDNTNHWKECTECHVAKTEEGTHAGGTATCSAKKVCDVCQLSYGDLAPCDYINEVDDQYLVSAATCVAKAVYKKSCSVCGAAHATETFEAGEVDQDNHTEIVGGKAKEYCANGCGTVIYDLAEVLAGVEEYTLTENITTDGPIVIASKVTINLGGFTIASTENDKIGDGIFKVVAGGELTINGEGTLNAAANGSGYAMAIWADGGKVIINGGIYTNVGAGDHDQYDLIYVKNGGIIEINGGEFISETPRWTLNSHNTEVGEIVVKGGSFYQYDPSNINTDEAEGVQWVAEGYEVKAEGDYYFVNKHVHDYNIPNKDAENHWNECACGEKENVAPHEFTTPKKDDENHWNECACGEKKDVAPHEFTTPNKDDENHWNECACGEKENVAPHEFTTPNKDDENHWNECACGEKKDVAPHEFTTPNKDAENHWNECACGEKKDVAPHEFTTPNKDDANHWTECACGEKKDVAPHEFTTPNKDAENHWNECACGAIDSKEEHKYDNACDTTCNICTAVREVGPHKYDNAWDKTCNICSAERKITHTGWAYISGKWYYYENGNAVKNAWRKDSTGWVYLGADGAMVKSKWVLSGNGKWYYCDANGYMVTNQWKKDSKGWIYLDSNGSMTKAKWVKDGGKWYYCDATGYMVANRWMKDSKGWVYLGSNGAMVINKWVKDSKGWCYVGSDGYAITNQWKKDSHGWIYLDSNGSMTKSKWVQTSGKWYYCDANGYMVANKTLTIGGKKYTFNASGVWVK